MVVDDLVLRDMFQSFCVHFRFEFASQLWFFVVSCHKEFSLFRPPARFNHLHSVCICQPSKSEIIKMNCTEWRASRWLNSWTFRCCLHYNSVYINGFFFFFSFFGVYLQYTSLSALHRCSFARTYFFMLPLFMFSFANRN